MSTQNVVPKSPFERMASGEYKFPPQKQYTQPGKEYLMNPPPQYSSPDYKPSNKLQGKGQEDIDARDTLEIIRKAKSADAKDPMAIAVDLGYEQNCKSVIDQVVNAYGSIDVLVNNAAVQFQSDSLDEIDDKRLDMHMKEGSSIINSTSVVAYQGFATLVDYASTKGAIVGFTRSLALQLVSKGIRVNGVAPGPIWTPLQVASLTVEQIVVFGSDVTAMKRAGQPIEVAPSYVFLASNQCSSYITGQVLHPNGHASLYAHTYKICVFNFTIKS
ncbi:hypothetical protein V8G54_033563 [Vigna mungo]|uniref:Uncharacterized protein n=1 Tax=Vigna mungo TaxID=3915 RepID=A0AAQ3MP53_VIGMU